MEITILNISSGLAVKFPFALKDAFRVAFPSAKWNATHKQWELGSRSKARLEQWAEECKGVLSELQQVEELELKTEELKKIRSVIADVSRQIAETNHALKETESVTQALEQVAKQLAADREKLAAVKAELEAANLAKKDALDSVHAALRGVLDLNALEEACREMARWHRQVGSTAKQKFHAAQAELLEMQESLKKAGWRNAGIDFMCDANFNRPERDHFSLMPSGALENFERI